MYNVFTILEVDVGKLYVDINSGFHNLITDSFYIILYATSIEICKKRKKIYIGNEREDENMAKGKAKQVEIKDLPILNIGGKNYYAFNVALRYLKQNNKEQFKGMTQKKFKEQFGEDSIFKLVGCGSWISVELFNELANKMTKVVVKTLDQEIRWKQDGAKLGQLFFVKDEVTAKAHQQLVSQIPAKAMESLEKFEAVSCDRDGERLMDNLNHLIDITHDFHNEGYTSVMPYLYEDGTGYLIGNGVFLQVNNWGYDYELFNGFDESGDWEADKHGKICRFVDEFKGVPEHMKVFEPCPIDFTGMTPKQAIAECFNRGLFIDDCDFMSIQCGSIDVNVDHNLLLHIISGESYQLPSHLDKKGRLVDLTDILANEGIVVDDCKSNNVINDTYEYEPQVIDAEFVEVIEGM